MTRTFEGVRDELRAFVAERDWDQFHAPKDLALSLAVEAGELLEIFQWRNPGAAALTPEDRQRLADELADVAMYAMLLADKAGLDLLAAIEAKMARNRERYPVEKARGRSEKSTKL